MLDANFVDPELADHRGDLLFGVEAFGRTLYLYVVVEHRSTDERFLTLDMLRYVVRIFERHREAHSGESELRGRTLGATGFLIRFCLQFVRGKEEPRHRAHPRSAGRARRTGCGPAAPVLAPHGDAARPRAVAPDSQTRRPRCRGTHDQWCRETACRGTCRGATELRPEAHDQAFRPLASAVGSPPARGQVPRRGPRELISRPAHRQEHRAGSRGRRIARAARPSRA
ncbi:MAG: Rpn family recombination-promoting nuclease/putative transposase [Planctomycetes bacterium]|nr:Rpn family recombination-promoting nuclease/putative transposase [Planctomycetota bacterium]